jgi:hypothetical protein
MRGVLWQVVIGSCAGHSGALYAGYLMKSLLYGVGHYDPWALAGCALMLVLCAPRRDSFPRAAPLP